MLGFFLLFSFVSFWVLFWLGFGIDLGFFLEGQLIPQLNLPS